MKLTWEEVRARRLACSRLLEPAASAVEAARETCGIQAQLQVAAEIGLGLRSGATQEEIRSAGLPEPLAGRLGSGV